VRRTFKKYPKNRILLQSLVSSPMEYTCCGIPTTTKTSVMPAYDTISCQLWVDLATNTAKCYSPCPLSFPNILIELLTSLFLFFRMHGSPVYHNVHAVPRDGQCLCYENKYVCRHSGYGQPYSSSKTPRPRR